MWTDRGADKKDAQLCLATSADLIQWKRQGLSFPSYKGKWNVKWTKSGAIVPEKINGKYWMYYLADAKGQRQSNGRCLLRRSCSTGRRPLTTQFCRAARIV